MLRGYSLELRSYGVVLVVGTVSFRWMSSFGVVDLSTSFRPKGYTTLLHERKSLGLCRICLTSTGIGRADISLFRGRIGYAVQRSGLQCPMASTILGYCQRFRFSAVSFFFYFFLCIFVKYLTSSFLFFSQHLSVHNWWVRDFYMLVSWDPIRGTKVEGPDHSWYTARLLWWSRADAYSMLVEYLLSSA